MKIKYIIISLLITLIFPMSALAINAPTVDAVPSSINADTYILTIRTEPGAKITVVGGPSDLAPITDGAGKDVEDGVVNFMVALAQDATNTFSIVAAKDGSTSSSVMVTIEESSNAESSPVTDDTPVPTLYDDTEPKEITEAETVFGDAKDHWAEQYILDLYEKGVVSGKSETSFDPDAPITRAELTKIAMLAFGHNIPTTVTEKPFSDVPADAWFAPYITAAKSSGVSEGYADGTYKPGDYINRAAALKIIIRAAGVDAKGVLDNFSDVPTTAWFATYVTYAYQNDIVGGYPDGTFRPGNNITRAEVTKIVVKMSEME